MKNPIQNQNLIDYEDESEMSLPTDAGNYNNADQHQHQHPPIPIRDLQGLDYNQPQTKYLKTAPVLAYPTAEDNDHKVDSLEGDEPKLLYGGEPMIVEKEFTNKWLVYNSNIQYGYRTNYKDNALLLKSVCKCHNETSNVWTHLAGALVFIGVMFYTLWFWTPLRLEHGQFISRMKEKNWGDFINANNYNDILSYFNAVTEDGVSGFKIYQKLDDLWLENTGLFKIGTEEFKDGIGLIMNNFTGYFKKKASLVGSDVNAFTFLIQKVSFF
jgi:hypothetical protein